MSEPGHRWRALEELYQAALEREPSARPEFLQQACPDPALREEVQTLLNSLDSGSALLERPAISFAAPPLQAGAMIGQYRIECSIGSGGMGEVYRAADTHLRRAVAVKVLPGLYASDIEWLARFDREARVLASFNHPNIAAIYGVEDRALIMELVEGPTLAERIAEGPIPLDEALPIFRQIADAIGYAHHRRIVHRDLKPANIKLAPAADGVPSRVKVLDFGVAKALESSSTLGPTASTRSTSAAITMAGAARGTPAYMSPEQSRGEPVDERADIWAFGAVAFEMLTGRGLFVRSTIKDTFAAVRQDPIDLSGIAPRARRILEHCLDRNLRTRWRSARYILLMLDDDRPAQAPPGRALTPWILAALFALLSAFALYGWWRATH